MGKRYRPSIPLKVKLIAALRELGLTQADVEFDHCPPLGLREYDEASRTYTPPANDPDKIVMRLKEKHREKTHHPLGPHTSVGSDQHMIAKTRHGRGDKFLVKKPLSLPVEVDPGRRCVGCGQYPDECRCPPLPQRSSFRPMRRA